MAEEDFNDKEKESGSDKDFGLPKVEITPIQQSEEPSGAPLAPLKSKKVGPNSGPETLKAPESAAKTPGKAENKENKTNKRSWIIWMLLLLFLGVGAWFYFDGSMHRINEEEFPSKDEVETPLPPEPEPKIDEVPEEPVDEITLTEISSRADLPRYFVVVGSFIDQDLAMDYSQELNQKGFNTFLISPYGESDYYRLSIGHFNSFGLAVKEMSRVKADFDENLWVLKY
ncbi:MAG: SPOR domain-containing protein [Anditalea sp.]